MKTVIAYSVFARSAPEADWYHATVLQRLPNFRNGDSVFARKYAGRLQIFDGTQYGTPMTLTQEELEAVKLGSKCDEPLSDKVTTQYSKAMRH